MNITTKQTNFQFYDFRPENMTELYKTIASKEQTCDLATDTPGFFNATYEANNEIVAAGFKEIVSREFEALEDGKMQNVKHLTIDEGFMVIFKNMMVTFGKPAAIKSAFYQLRKITKCDPQSLTIAPERLFKISDHMAFIRTMDFDHMEHPTVKKLRFDGKIETIADISPFHNYTANIKSVKGVINTPHGIRTIKIAYNGKIQISKKKEEELDAELFKWLFDFVKNINTNF